MVHVLAVEALLELAGDALGENGREQVVDALEILARDIVLAVGAQVLERVGEHIVDVLDEYALVLDHRWNTPCRLFSQRCSLASSSNQYSVSIGRMS